MKVISIILFLIILSSSNCIAQQKLIIYNTKSGNGFTFKRNDKMIVFVDGKKIKYRIKSLSDSGIFTNKNTFINYNNIQKIRIGDSRKYIIWPLVSALAGVTIALIIHEVIGYEVDANLQLIIVNSLFYFNIYQMIIGYKRTYQLDEKYKIIYFPDELKIPKD